MKNSSKYSDAFKIDCGDFIIKIDNLSFIYESTLKNSNIDFSSIEEENIEWNQLLCERYSEELERLKALNSINLEVEEGKFIGLMGNTGSGKSTFVRTLNGLIPHFYNGIFYGVVNVCGKDTITEKIRDLSLKVGLVFQNPENQLVMMNVEREIAFGLENRGISKEVIRKKIDEIMDFLDIKHLKDKHPYELSGGEQQRVAIASILVVEPKVIILDEPTAALDQKSALKIIKLLKKINEERKITVIVIEHRLEMVLPYCDDILIMKEGKIIEYGSIKDILNGNKIYHLPLELPYYIQLLHFLREKGVYSGSIPNDYKKFKAIIHQIFPYIKDGNNANDYKNTNSNKGNGNNYMLQSVKKSIGIELRNVSYEYSNHNKAINGISLRIYKGESIGIIGKNGAGKSTFLRLLNGLYYPTKGKVLVEGIPTNKYKPSELTRKVGLMFQNPERQLFCNSVGEELDFSLKNLGLNKEEINVWKTEIIKRLNLHNLISKSPFELSGGERKKVSIATILCRNPEYILFDEPTVGQDKEQRIILQQLIDEERKKGKTIIIVSHDTDFIYRNTDRAIIFDEGEILADGGTEEVLSNSNLLKLTSVLTPQIVELKNIFKEYLSQNKIMADKIKDIENFKEFIGKIIKN
ncbi:MAG: ABC transporter ATP-binding protein [Promethearchaeota archaeon]